MRLLRTGCLRQAAAAGWLPRPLAWIEGAPHQRALVEPDAGDEATELARSRLRRYSGDE
jgi:hypothetical protein